MKEKVIRDALNVITGDRQSTYGHFEECYARVARFWEIWLNMEPYTLDTHDIGQMMSLLKKARTKGGIGHLDNYVDDIGYSALAAESKCGPAPTISVAPEEKDIRDQLPKPPEDE